MAVRISINKGNPKKNLEVEEKNQSITEFLTKKPDFLIRNSSKILLVLLLIIGITSYLIEYPEIIVVPAKLIFNKTATTGAWQKEKILYAVNVVIPAPYSKKIKKRQKVIITFSESTNNKIVSLKGSISGLSFNSKDSSCLVRIDLVKRTNIVCCEERLNEDTINASIQITTTNIRLMTRIISNFLRQFKR